MIKQFHIQNFKSHPNTTLNLSNINILTGLNGMGKSSVIQSLLLLRQSNTKNFKGLELNGELCEIGVTEDALYQSAKEDFIEISFKYEEHQYVWKFEASTERLTDTFLRLMDDSDIPENYDTLNLFNNKFQYISAFRSGPNDDYVKNTSAVELENQISKTEGRCEFVAHYLDYNGKKLVNSALLRNPNEDDTLSFQVKQWMRDISPNININIKPSGLNYKIDYSFDRGSGLTETLHFKAKNIGFGISYVLPIVIVALNSSPGTIVIIENPEAHIHPGGQAKLMELICKASKRGVQFIIETHSDHIINGLLVATKKGILDNNDSSIYYFQKDISSHSTIPIHLPVLDGGKIQRPPKGFFDQLDKDMDILMGIADE